MDKEFLEKCLRDGMSTRDIEKVCGLDHRTVHYWIDKYKINDLNKYKKEKPAYIDKVNTKEKAYAVGFILGDGCISGKPDYVSISVAMNDAEIIDFFVKQFGGKRTNRTKFDKKSRTFPNARFDRKINGIASIIGSGRKEERHYPRVRDDVERYMIQGFFDAEGCITWGRRKDTGRIWQKISFTSQYKILYGVQQYLLNKLEISTVLRPKTGCNCYVLDFSSKKDVLKFLDHIYPDDSFIILHRKYQKACALRLELEENGGTTNAVQSRAEPAEQEGVETSGAVATPLNNHKSIQGAA